jgi:hypothetical protein
MLKKPSGIAAHHLGMAALTLLLIPLICPASAAPKSDPANAPRVETMYTTWDDYYFYAAFRIHDTAVYGTNITTTSQPQQDDDVEIFFENDDARAKVRTPQTFQMAVSAAQGAYFSVGDGTKTPKGKAVYSYKYAVTVNGTLNKPDAKTTGYDVEMAIPWTELGLTKAPQPGATWGFNVVSRDRSSLALLADGFYSLSGKVRGKGDVQNPSKWSRITFVTGAARSTTDKVVCAKVVGQFPRINGAIVSGDWPAATQLAFGTDAVQVPAPTVAEEPNTTESPFDNPPAMMAPPAARTASALGGIIDMPGGGIIKVVPGGIKNPVGLDVPVPPPPPAPKPKRGRGSPGPVQTAQNSATPEGVMINSASFELGQPKPPAYIMGIYRLDYNADSRKAPGQNVWNPAGGTLLADQPMNGAGPWFSGLRPQWHRQQISDMRRAGIEVALLRTRPDDALLPRELDAFVTALKDMKAAGMDYPLVGVDATAGRPDLDMIYAHVPSEFRALSEIAGAGRAGVLVYDLSLGADDKKALADGTPVARLFYNSGVASVSPGRVDKNGVVSRRGGRTYDTAWQVAMVSTPAEVVVDSWNDFLHGTEIAASRQYGEQYADATKAAVIVYDGNRPWHAKYLAHWTPRTVYPKTLYQIPIRVENAGTLPWRAGEGYSLSTRWYRNGKLYDDSAPRIPVAKDVLPGQALTLSVGLVARNNFGEDLEPGDYTLVFDMVQSQQRWFSYAGDTPLQVPVTVIGADSGVGGTAANFISAATPGVVQVGAAAQTTVQVRNDGASAWPAGYTLGYKIQTVDPDGSDPRTVAEGGKPLDPAPNSSPITPGQIAVVSLAVPTVDAGGRPLAPGAYRLHWFVRPDALGPAVAGAYDEVLTLAASLPGAAFVLADLPRTMDAGKEETAHIAIQNQGSETLKKDRTRIGYHWYYLDGTERTWEGGPAGSLTKDLPPAATDGDITTTFRAPKTPGRYALVWDVRVGDGPWQSTLPASRGDDALQILVNVAGKGASIVPVDLTKSFNTVGIASGEVSKTGGFDGHGATLPAEVLPPDGTAEVEGNPFIMGKPGLPLYPSGYYTAQTGAGEASNHAVSFLYPSVHEGLPNVVACTGQTISIPSGRYKALHLLAAATGGASAQAGFSLQFDRDTQPLTVSIADWGAAPTGAGVTAAFTASYRYSEAGIKPLATTLGDYALRLDTGRKLTGLTLPNDRNIKIVAISLEKE